MSKLLTDKELYKEISKILDYEGDTLHHNSIDNLVMLIQSQKQAHTDMAESSTARYWEAKYNTRVDWLEKELFKITGNHYSDRSKERNK